MDIDQLRAALASTDPAGAWNILLAGGGSFEQANRLLPERLAEIEGMHKAAAAARFEASVAQESERLTAQRAAEIRAHAERQQAEGKEWTGPEPFDGTDTREALWMPVGTLQLRAEQAAMAKRHAALDKTDVAALEQYHADTAAMQARWEEVWPEAAAANRFQR